MASEEFKHDVAFSFLSSDLGLAKALADEIAPLKAFVYSRKQEELISNGDGVDARQNTPPRALTHQSSSLNPALPRKPCPIGRSCPVSSENRCS